jgi:hypothetical protein
MERETGVGYMVNASLAFRRPLGIGEVLDGGFQLFRASLLKCIPYAAVAAAAGQLPTAYDIASGRSLRAFASRDPLWWTIYVVATLVSLVMWSAVLLRQHRIATGQPLDAPSELRTALARLPAALGSAIGFALAVTLGLMLLLIPGLYLITALSMSAPVMLIERRGPRAALAGSYRLVEGHWWRTTAIITASGIIVAVFYAVGGLIGAVAAVPLAGSADVVVVTAITSVLFLLLGALGVPLYSALMLATYSDLRVRREGSDLAQRIAALGGL